MTRSQEEQLPLFPCLIQWIHIHHLLPAVFNLEIRAFSSGGEDSGPNRGSPQRVQDPLILWARSRMSELGTIFTWKQPSLYV